MGVDRRHCTKIGPRACQTQKGDLSTPGDFRVSWDPLKTWTTYWLAGRSWFPTSFPEIAKRTSSLLHQVWMLTTLTHSWKRCLYRATISRSTTQRRHKSLFRVEIPIEVVLDSGFDVWIFWKYPFTPSHAAPRKTSQGNKVSLGIASRPGVLFRSSDLHLLHPTPVANLSGTLLDDKASKPQQSTSARVGNHLSRQSVYCAANEV